MKTAAETPAGEQIRIVPFGDLLHHRYETLEQALFSIAGRDAHIVVDLGRTEFISSSGIGFLLRLKELAESRGGSVTLKNPSPLLRRIFTKLQLHTVFRIVAGDAGAVQESERPEHIRSLDSCRFISFIADIQGCALPGDMYLRAC